MWARKLLTDKGIDPKSSGTLGGGFYYGWTMCQALLIASQLDGGLNRTNFLLAQRSMDMTHPYLVSGIKLNMNGNADPYFVEGSEIALYDAAEQRWRIQGEVIDLSGRSKPCVWDQATSVCT